jgi:UDP-N-acetyl-D-mannosaminuronate dehydrogenase
MGCWWESTSGSKDCNIYIVTVPTPIDSSNRPDLTPLIKSSQTIEKVELEDGIRTMYKWYLEQEG